MRPATYAYRISTGYYHVRFGPHIFVQWPDDRPPVPDDVFGASEADRHAYAEAAERRRSEVVLWYA